MPFIATAYIAVASLFLIPGANFRWDYMGPALGLLVVLTVAVFLVPWRRLPDWAQPIIPYLFILDTLLLNVGANGLGGIGPLVFLAVLWLALYGTPREVLTSIVLVAVRLWAPIAFDLPNGLSPLSAQYRGLLLFTAVAALVGFTVNSIVWKMRAARDDAARAGEQLRELLEAAPDPTVVVDEDGRIVLANHQVEEVFGYLPRELVGSPVETIIQVPSFLSIRRMCEAHTGRTARPSRPPPARGR